MFKNFQLTAPFILTFLLCNPLDAAPLKFLSMDFTRELTENNNTERTIGFLHYNFKTARVVVEVTEPIKQIMIVKDNVLEIYYPAELQAFRFISPGRVPLPFVESIIQSTQTEFGLSTIGYSLDEHVIVADMLYTYWTPPKKVKDKIGAVILGMRDNRLFSTDVKNPQGDIIANSQYQNHRKVGMHFIPMTVNSKTYGANSEVFQHERIAYSNPRANEETPNPMLNFTVPESVNVRVVKW